MGRPKGSKNKPKAQKEAASAAASSVPSTPGDALLPPGELPDKINKTLRGLVFCFTVHYGHVIKDLIPEDPIGFMMIKIQKIHQTLSDNNYIRSAAMQLERCPTSGVIHIQGYLQWKDDKRMSACYKMFNAHWTLANGSAHANWKYCTEDDTHVPNTPRLTVGEPVSQGQRTDMVDTVRDVMEGRATARDVMENDPMFWMRNYRALAQMELARVQPRTEKPHITWLWGESGTGKTKWVYDRWSYGDVYAKPSGLFWDRYHGQQCILFDDLSLDMDEGFYREFLRWTDRYPCQGGVKLTTGGVEINSPYIVITCEFHPQMVFRGNRLTQIMRRVDEFIELKKEE